jgi:hypothetical protein
MPRTKTKKPQTCNSNKDADKLCELARTFAITANNLCSENKHELAKDHAIIATDLYHKLFCKYQFRQNEMVFVRLCDNVMDQYILWKYPNNNKILERHQDFKKSILVNNNN